MEGKICNAAERNVGVMLASQAKYLVNPTHKGVNFETEIRMSVSGTVHHVKVVTKENQART